MNEKSYLKKDQILTDNAKMIFGNDLVSTAYYADYYYAHHGEKEKQHILDGLKRQSKINHNVCGEIEQDSLNIVIDFKNGRSVLFTNSEWGSMSSYLHSEFTHEIYD